MRFLMNTLLALISTAVDSCVLAKLSLDALGRAAVFVSSAKTRSRHPSLLAWRNYSSRPFGASSILLLKAAGTAYMHPKSLPAVISAPPQTVLFPDADPRQG